MLWRSWGFLVWNIAKTTDDIFNRSTDWESVHWDHLLHVSLANDTMTVWWLLFLRLLVYLYSINKVDNSFSGLSIFLFFKSGLIQVYSVAKSSYSHLRKQDFSLISRKPWEVARLCAGRLPMRKEIVWNVGMHSHPKCLNKLHMKEVVNTEE